MHLRLSSAAQALVPGEPPVALAPRDAALLAWLALQGPTSRTRLARLLWPDSSDEAARNSLRQRLFQMKRSFHTELVVGQAILQLAPHVDHDLDHSPTVLAQVVFDFQGELADWLAAERLRRHQARAQTLAQHVDVAEQAQDWGTAIARAAELLALEPLSEAAHRRVMRLHYLAGDRAAALLAFDRCERTLKDEVGARPSDETLALLGHIEAAAPSPAPRPPAVMPAAVLRPPRMVGRDRERRALEAAWAAGHVASVIGEAGLGKTRLLQEFVAAQQDARAADAGPVPPATLYAAGRPGDVGVPFATLARLLRTLVASSPESTLPEPTRGELARVLPELTGAGVRPAGAGQRLVLLRAVRSLLATSKLGTLLVDDLHFADEASLDLLASLVDDDDAASATAAAHPTGPTPCVLRWVLAWRPAEAASALQALHDRLVEQVRLVPVVLAPLDEAALAELVDSLGLPGVSGAALAPGLLQRTGGNPLFVLETLKQAWVERALTHPAPRAPHGAMTSLPRPLSVSRLIERRVAQLSPGALALARVASIAGVDFSMELAESVLQVGALQFADALNELESAQVLRGTAFAHDLVFDAVRASVPQAIAQLTHARVAAWLAPRPSEPARVARHWLDAGRDEEALPWLERAAERAGAAVRRREQIDFLDRKSRIEEGLGRSAQAFDTLMQAAEIEVTLSDGVDAAPARCDRLELLAVTTELRVRVATQRSNLAEMRGFHAEAEQAAQAALREALLAGVGGAALAQARIALGTALSGQERPKDALPHFEASMEWITTHAGPGQRCEFHGNLANVYDRLARLVEGAHHHRRAMELAREVGDYTNQAICLSNLASNRFRLGLMQEAARALEQARLVYVQAEEPSSIGGFIAIECTSVHRQMGQYTRALQDLETGLENLQQFAPGYTEVLDAHRAACWAHLGQWARFERVVDGILRKGVPAPRLLLRLALYRRAQAWALGTAEDTAALGQLLDAADTTGAADFRHSVLIERAALQGGAEGLAALAQVVDEAHVLGHDMTLHGALARSALLALGLGRRDQALRDAQSAWALHGQVWWTVGYPLEPWLHCARVFEGLGEHSAWQQVCQASKAWITHTAQRELEPVFGDAFLHRNPVNRELLAMASRAG